MRGVVRFWRNTPLKNVVFALAVSSTVSIGLLLARFLGGGSTRFWFLLWNLVLAWLPLVFAAVLVYRLRAHHWLSVPNIILTILWLVFLPNSFYLVTDLIHLHLTGEVNILYDAVMFTSFIFTAYAFGFISVHMVHVELLKRLSRSRGHVIIAGVLLASSFAIYLGRVMRWNTWDLLVAPAGVLFDVSEQVVNPVKSPESVVTTVSFFLLLSSIYFVIWQLIQTSQHASRR